jgi:hypothetical protein
MRYTTLRVPASAQVVTAYTGALNGPDVPKSDWDGQVEWRASQVVTATTEILDGDAQLNGDENVQKEKKCCNDCRRNPSRRYTRKDVIKNVIFEPS